MMEGRNTFREEQPALQSAPGWLRCTAGRRTDWVPSEPCWGARMVLGTHWSSRPLPPAAACTCPPSGSAGTHGPPSFCIVPHKHLRQAELYFDSTKTMSDHIWCKGEWWQIYSYVKIKRNHCSIRSWNTEMQVQVLTQLQLLVKF